MKLVVIARPQKSGQFDLNVEFLQKAAKKHGIGFQVLQAEEIDPVHPEKILDDYDLLYRGAIDDKSILAEGILLRENIAHFSTLSQEKALHYDYHRHESRLQYGVNVPKQAYIFSKDRTKIEKIVKHLGGFPIIVKVMNGSHGVGIMRADSLPSLLATIDFLLAQNAPFILKEYLEAKGSARCVVLGDKVVDSYVYKTKKGDFRSNEGEPVVVQKKFSKDIEDMALRATRAAGVEFSGVDLIISKGKGYVLETNYPCNFSRAQMLSKKDIASMMVQHLMKKSELLKTLAR